MIDDLTHVLYFISNTLLIPDIALLLLLFTATVLHVGGFAAELAARRRHEPEFRAFVDRVKRSPGQTIDLASVPARYGLPRIAFAELRETREAKDKTLDDLQMRCDRLLSRLNLGVRLGPVLGLAGTLIPLGPALVALSTGDVATLSSKLVVAFSTTVLGLFIGGACYALYSVRRSWYTKELNDIEFLAGKLEA